jgi:hypothetical protein
VVDDQAAHGLADRLHGDVGVDLDDQGQRPLGAAGGEQDAHRVLLTSGDTARPPDPA